MPTKTRTEAHHTAQDLPQQNESSHGGIIEKLDTASL